MSERNDNPPVCYRVQASAPEAHLFAVDCTVDDPDAEGQVFFLPAWIPGSYLIREFAKNVVSFRAHSSAGRIASERLDKNRWQCAPCTGPLTVTCEVYAWDLSVRSAHLDTTHGYFNGTSLFLSPVGREQRPCVVDIQRPVGSRYQDWQVATAMPRLAAPPWGFGTYRAADYDELIDHPVEIGRFARAGFEACGVTHDLVVSGRQRADLERLCADLARVCGYHIGFFGEPAPMDRYLFQLQVVGEGYGGLEHRASTSLICSREDLPVCAATHNTDKYRSLLGLCSHEYFHTWNVKRIRPALFTPYRLDRETHTRLLWAFEGITSYYDNLALRRCGLIDRRSYLELLGRTATRVWREGGRFRQSVTDSSFDAWTRFYKQDENAPNAIVSYYAKGALVALALDLTIRLGTRGERSLDDVMRALWQRYGRTGKGVPEDGVERLAAEVSGLDLEPFFQQYLRATVELPLAELMARFGILFKLRAATSQTDKGGLPADDEPPGLVLGVRSSAEAAGSRLTHVLDGGAAQQAGLSAGDLVVAVDGLRVNADNLESRVAALDPGRAVRVQAFRRDELMEFEVLPRPPPADTVYLQIGDLLDVDTERRLADWIGID